jgi:hypothetical protein
MTKICFCVFLLLPLVSFCQLEVVALRNPSFELSRELSLLEAWEGCGEFKEESLPDLQPGQLGCDKPAAHGDHYLGIVTRANGTWERICQVLDKALQPDSVYWFAIQLASSAKYFSGTRTSKEQLNFSDPVKLRIWGVNLDHTQSEVMAETNPVNHDEWMVYEMQLFVPDFEVAQIVFEAYYPDSERKTAGNLLLDNCSALYPSSMYSDFLKVKNTLLNPKGSSNHLGLSNPSFECRSAIPYQLPNGWRTYQPNLLTPHRTHPAHFEFETLHARTTENKRYHIGAKVIRQYPTEGNSFISLLASEFGDKQSISSELSGILRKGIGHTFSLDAAYSPFFRQKEKDSKIETNYSKPLRLLIWGGTRENPKAELLAESDKIEQTKWKRLHFVLKPAQNQYTMLTLEAEYVPEIGKRYNGNILLDNCSSLGVIK